MMADHKVEGSLKMKLSQVSVATLICQNLNICVLTYAL